MRKRVVTYEDYLEMQRLRYEEGLSLPDIGRKIHGIDHSTVLHNLNKRDWTKEKRKREKKVNTNKGEYIDPIEGKINKGKLTYDDYLRNKKN